MTLDKRKHLDKIPDEQEFYQHQIDGVRRMVRMSGALLADEMGLGKSLSAATVAACAIQELETKKVLIVSPASLKGVWGDELNEHTAFTWTVVPSGISKAKRSAVIRDYKTDMLIVNYEQVITHVVELNAIGFGMIIYDEAHMIKSRKSARTKACFKLRAPRHFLLTGSPLLNQVDDLWALLYRIDPVEWPNYWKFINRYAVYGGWGDKQIVGIKNEAELRERLAKYMLRREKKECLDLPEKQFIQVKLDPHPEQKRMYDHALIEMQVLIPNAPPLEINNALTKFLRLKQICGTTATQEGCEDFSSKLDRAVEITQEVVANGEPIVIFTQFRGVLACMVNRLEKLLVPIPTWQLHGNIKAEDRKPMVNDWTSSAQRGYPGALICMYQVGGVGLTMTAASKVILLDKLFVPKLNEQAVDRLHRIGQKRTVQIYELIMRGTVEARIERILKQKNTIFGAVVDIDNSNWKRKLIQAMQDTEESDEV